MLQAPAAVLGCWDRYLISPWRCKRWIFKCFIGISRLWSISVCKNISACSTHSAGCPLVLSLTLFLVSSSQNCIYWDFSFLLLRALVASVVCLGKSFVRACVLVEAKYPTAVPRETSRGIVRSLRWTDIQVVVMVGKSVPLYFIQE